MRIIPLAALVQVLAHAPCAVASKSVAVLGCATADTGIVIPRPAPITAMMQECVLALGSHQLQVFWTVIRAYVVDVVDILIVPQGASEHLLHDEAMLIHPSAVSQREHDVSTRADVTAPFPVTVGGATHRHGDAARPGAVFAPAPTDLPLHRQERLTALQADALDFAPSPSRCLWATHVDGPTGYRAVSSDFGAGGRQDKGRSARVTGKMRGHRSHPFGVTPRAAPTASGLSVLQDTG